jgi:hypothetical protein
MLRTFPDFYAGDSINYAFDLRDDAGAPLDCQNAKIWLTLKHKPEDLDTDAVLQTMFRMPQYSDLAKYGKVSIFVPGTMTSPLAATLYWWDLKLCLWNQTTCAMGTVKTIGLGVLRVNQEITRSYS